MTNYNDKLSQDYTAIRSKVKRGMLPLVARNPAIDKAVGAYAVAHAEYYANAVTAGKNPPINYKDNNALDRFANLVLHEELTWSHPDKMSIVEYPVMSDRQAEASESKYMPKSDLQFGDLRHLGKRRTSAVEDDITSEGKRRIIEPSDPTIEAIGEYADLYDALANAGLTTRQREAIDLVYFGNCGDGVEPKEAAVILGITRQAVELYVKNGIAKLTDYMTKS